MDQPRTIALQGEWVVAFDGHDHRIIRNGAVAYRGDRIVAVGPASEIVADEVIPGRRKLVMPGLISLHAHLRLNEGYRMVLDGGRRDFMRAGFINYAGRKEGGGPAFLDPGDPLVALRFCMATHLLSGVTTILEMDAGAPERVESCAALVYSATGDMVERVVVDGIMRVAIALRPERIRLGAEARAADNRVTARLTDLIFVGDRLRGHCALPGGRELVFKRANDGGALPERGETLELGWAQDDARAWQVETGATE
jgi:cytosine/adenosine deaminase-related metal-dependent hydrolase